MQAAQSRSCRATKRIQLVVVGLVALALAPAAVAGTSTHILHLRWPFKVDQSVTHRPSVKVAGHIRSVTLRYKGFPVPRGFDVNYIVDCVHRGPATLNWDWAARGGYLLLRVKMTVGQCTDGPTVVGKTARLLLTIRTG